MEFEVNIGLETHVQLRTRSKMWCACANQFGAEPNTNVCPVCLGLPGVLPVANEEALRLTVLTGLLLHSRIPPRAMFDRKNYFYPDVAKNYQITQLAHPSTLGGHVDFEFGGGLRRVRITRAHLEEDVGKNNHFDRHSGVDFNRAGVPLLEIVSEPDLTSADMAYEYLNALKDILVYGGVSDADMEKGMVRCDVNVSVRPRGQAALGAKIEIKNMNSFSGVRRALQYEIPRQIEAVTKGEKLRQETRRWDDVAGMTEVMRSKEHAHDYRYFPEPDLLPFEPTDAWLADIRSRADSIIPTLPQSRRVGLMRYPTLTEEDINALSKSPAAGDLFDITLKTGDHGKPVPSGAEKAVANVVTNLYGQVFNSKEVSLDRIEAGTDRIELHGQDKEGTRVRFQIPASGTFDLANSLYFERSINNATAQTIAFEMIETGRAVPEIISTRGLAQVSDTAAIERLCEEAIAANPGPAADFRAGKAAALNRLKGHVMKLSQGKANPAVVGELLERKLKS